MSAIEPDARLRQAGRIASRVIDGRAVVIVIDDQKLHTLNDVGTFVWSALGSEERSVDELIDEVLEAYDVEREQAARDVTTFVEQLLELGALEVRMPT